MHQKTQFLSFKTISKLLKIFIFHGDIKYFAEGYYCFNFFAVILQVTRSFFAVQIVLYFVLRSCDMLKSST
jgi:hypothetical protein